MSAFAGWGLTVLGIAVVTTISEMLLPKGRLQKVIRSVFATVTALVIVAPLPTLIGGKLDFSQGGEVELDQSYLEYVDGSRKKIVLSAAYDALEKAGYKDAVELDAALDGWKVISVSVKFRQSIIMENGEHINKKEIIRLIAECYGIGEEAVMTYG